MNVSCGESTSVCRISLVFLALQLARSLHNRLIAESRELRADSRESRAVELSALHMRRLASAALFVVLTLAPAAASAVTVDQIVALSKAGISEPIILALIERDKTV